MTPVVYASPRQLFQLTSLRLSPPERGKHATLRKMQSPVAPELLELLATANMPQADRVVIRRTDKQLRIRGAELEAIDARTAIFPIVSFTGNCSTPLPPWPGLRHRENR